MNTKNMNRRSPPKIAEAGEIPSPAKRARQTTGLKTTQREASGNGMKSAGGVAGGVPQPKRPAKSP
jgi:hypothetical protein